MCVWALYSTLANLNDVSLRLFKIATDLNEIKGKNKAVQRLSGRGGRDSSGSGLFLHVSVEMEGKILMLKHFFHFHPAPSRSTSRPHSFFSLYLCCLPVCALDRKSIGGAGLGA